MLGQINGSYQRARELISISSHPWVSWYYDPEEWIEFDRREWEHSRSEIAKSVKTTLTLILLLGLATVVVNLSTTPFGGIGLLLLLLLVLTLILGAIGLVRQYAEAVRLRNARQRGPREVRITPMGFYEAGVYVPLVQRQLSLLRSYVTPDDPRVLRFLVSRFGGRSNQVYEVWVPIPKGQDEEAVQLAARFQQEVIRSR